MNGAFDSGPGTFRSKIGVNLDRVKGVDAFTHFDEHESTLFFDILVYTPDSLLRYCRFLVFIMNMEGTP